MVDVVLQENLFDDPGIWTHVVIEVYCMIDTEYHKCSCKYSYLLKGGDIDKYEKIENTDYNPDIKRPDTPEFCKKRYYPCYNCLSNDCPHLSYGEAEPELKDAVRKKFNELVAAEEKEDA